jgi:DNA-binding transcriptional MerR regulator
MDDPSLYRPPQTVAKELDISPATLRRWSDEFADYLSRGADSAQGRSHRRYSEHDITTLTTIKELMNNGMTYEQVRQQLVNRFTVPAESTLHLSPDPPVKDDFENSEYLAEINPNEESALVAANGAESPAIAFLTNTLIALSDSQKSILNSQTANRELMGVLIQDNFNLKDENNRLRERILEVERNAAQSRQEEEWRREALRQELDAKIATVQQLATEAITAANSVEVPAIKAINTKPGCLGALFSGGGTRIITIPRRRSREGQETRQVGPAPSPSQAPLSSQPPSAHPKPTAPPE